MPTADWIAIKSGFLLVAYIILFCDWLLLWSIILLFTIQFETRTYYFTNIELQSKRLSMNTLHIFQTKQLK